MSVSDLAALRAQHGLSDAALAGVSGLLRKATCRSQRYRDLGVLGRGGMAEVRRVLDPELNRVLAMKIIRPELMSRPAIVARFVEEAQCSAQLQHPGIVPVHEIGTLPDGRAYFTMDEVRGRPLSTVIAEVHRASPDERWQASPSGWTFRRLIDAVLRVCEAIAYAHDRGVVHRDLKPENIMVGPLGQVLVVDWGLAKIGVLSLPDGLDQEVHTDRSQTPIYATKVGQVAGTPAYMPPEQARGEVGKIDARSDVYALGAILYEVLSGRPPYEGGSALAVLQQVRFGPPCAPGRGRSNAGETLDFVFDATESVSAAGPPLPEDLVDCCLRAMSRDQSERFADGRALAVEIASWLDGAKRRERALAVVDDALLLARESEELRRESACLCHRSAALLAVLDPWQGEEAKAPGWSLADRAQDLDRQANAKTVSFVQTLHAALAHAPQLPEAHQALVDHHRADHQRAERSRDEASQARTATLLRTHALALPEAHPKRVDALAYLHGQGALCLQTEPPGAEVLLHRFVRKNRRLVAVFERSLGLTPLRRVPLDQGSYLCILRHPDRPDLRYPVQIGRQEHWSGRAPGDAEPAVVVLPEVEPTDACRVPAGWFWSGGDAECADGLPSVRLWCHGLEVQRHPVTHGAYIDFLDDLVASNREDEALRHMPRERAGTEDGVGEPLYGRGKDGGFLLQPDADGDIWQLDWPVFQVDWHGAVAYGEWWAKKTGQSWRLPSELEWEKAARGVDGRAFPWGDEIDPSWCCYAQSHAGTRLPASVHAFPVDESVYGVRGMGGNVRDWCAEVYRPAGPGVVEQRVQSPDLSASGQANRVSRGGAWGSGARYTRVADRSWNTPDFRYIYLGFRLVRQVP